MGIRTVVFLFTIIFIILNVVFIVLKGISDTAPHISFSDYKYSILVLIFAMVIHYSFLPLNKKPATEIQLTRRGLSTPMKIAIACFIIAAIVMFYTYRS